MENKLGLKDRNESEVISLISALNHYISCEFVRYDVLEAMSDALNKSVKSLIAQQV